MASKKKTKRKNAQRVNARAKAAKKPRPQSGARVKQQGVEAATDRPRSVAETDAERIIAAVRKIPRGRVCPYGVVAEVAGLPRRARLVGTVLRQTPATKRLPWFRVINASGRISFPQGSDAYARQRKQLEAEGVDFVGGRVDLDRYGWPPKEKLLDELVWGPR